jgi:hypothetical protein
MTDTVNRRSVVAALAGSATVLVPGCSNNSMSNNDLDDDPNRLDEDDQDNDGVPDSVDDYPNEPDLSREVRYVDDTRWINEGHWYHYGLNFTKPGELEIDFLVREGPAIDVLVLSESEYTYFERDERYEVWHEPSMRDSTGHASYATLPAGDYLVVFDNTGRSSAAPGGVFSDDNARVDIEIKAAE